MRKVEGKVLQSIIETSRSEAGRARRGLAGTVRLSFEPSKLCVEPTDHGRSRRGKKLDFHAPFAPKTSGNPASAKHLDKNRGKS